MRSHTLVSITILTTILALARAHGQPRIMKLDFGPEKAGVMAGFQTVTPKTLHTDDRGFGWQPYACGDWKQADVTHKQPDPLLADFIMMSGAKTRLRIDLPDGKYHLWFWTGRWGSNGWSLPPIEGFGLRSVDGGEAIHETTRDQYFDDNFGWQLRQWLTPDSDFHRDWMQRWFRRFDGTVTVKGGKLVLAPWRRFPLNGLVICPEKDRAETERWLAELAKKQRGLFSCRDLTPPVAEDFVPTAEERRRGLVLFAPQKETLVFPTSTPNPPAPRPKALTAFACPGEAESFTLAVRPLKQYDGVRARMTDLAGPVRIASADLTGYAVQMLPRSQSSSSYQYQGHLLREIRPRTLHKDQTEQYWWDVRVPADAPPGVYEGEIVLEADRGLRLACVPVSLRVLPVDLLSGDETGVKLMTPYANFSGYHWLQKWDLYRPIYTQDLLLMKACGLNTAMLAGDARPLGPTYAKAGHLPMSVLDVPFQRWQVCKDLGFKQVFWYGFQGLTSIAWRSPDSNRFAKALKDKYCGPKHRAALRDIVKTIEQMRRERDLPPLIVSIMDEAICHGAEKALPAYTKMNRYFAELKKEFGIRYAVLDSSYEVDGFVKGLDICAPSRKGNAKNFAKMDAVDAERWLYNTGLRRFQFGYYCWRAKLEGMWVWFYCDKRNHQLFPFENKSSALAYQTVNGPIPTIRYQWVREGIDDLRYLRTLESYVQRGIASKKPKAVAAAKRGREMLDALHSRMTDDYAHYCVNANDGMPAPGAWDPSTLDVVRRQVAEHAVAIAAALRGKAPTTTAAHPPHGRDWRVPTASARVPLRIHTGLHPRQDDIVEVPLASLPSGPVRVFMDREVPAFRDNAGGVFRFLLPSRVLPYEELHAMAYFGDGGRRSDPRLARPRLRNLVNNGDFEDGLNEWTVPENRGIKAQVVGVGPRRGKKSLRLDFDGRSGSMESAEFRVSPHTLLTMTAWARVISFQRPKPHIGAPVRVLVQFYNQDGNAVERFSSGWSTTHFDEKWRLMHGWRRVPERARTARVQIRNWWCKSTAFVDDIAVYAFIPPSCEVRAGKPEAKRSRAQ